MKLTDFAITNQEGGRVSIAFKEEITEDDYYEIGLFMRFFSKKKNKKKLKIYYKLKPVRIQGLMTHKNTWTIFLKTINLEKAKTWYQVFT